MGWIANIIADASYENDLFLGGYAGGVCLLHTEDPNKQITEMVAGVMPESPNSNIVEMRAATTMLHKLNHILKANHIQLDALHIYTDSRTLINEYPLFLEGQGNPIYAQHLELMKRTLAKIPLTAGVAEFHKVKAHVDNAVATPIERLHNLIDRNAKTARFLLQNHLFKPNLNRDHSRFGVVLNPATNAHEIAAQFAAGYLAAKAGLTARIYSTDKRVQPHQTVFADGVRHYQQVSGAPGEPLFTPVYAEFEGGMLEGCEGADRVYIRKDAMLHGEDARYYKFDTYNRLQGAAATRLMLGPQFIGHFNTTHLTGRTEPPSQFVVDAFESVPEFDRPGSVSQWIRRASEWNGVPIINGLDAFCQRFDWQPPEPAIFTDCVEHASRAVSMYQEMSPFMSSYPLACTLAEQVRHTWPALSVTPESIEPLLLDAGMDVAKLERLMTKHLVVLATTVLLEQAHPAVRMDIAKEKPVAAERTVLRLKN